MESNVYSCYAGIDVWSWINIILLFTVLVPGTLFSGVIKCVVVTEGDDTLLLLVWRLGVVMHRSFSGGVGSH